MHTLRCVSCGRSHPHNTRAWRCICGGRVTIEDAPLLTSAQIRTDVHSLWRYAEALPVHAETGISLGEGWTPLIPYRNAAREVLIKLDHLSPSGSYKDRGAALLLSRIRELEIERVVEDSSGNAGAAVAAYAAAAGISADIYVPGENSPGKLAQIRAYGATLFPVEGSRSDTAAAALRAAQEHYYASHVWNPYFLEGTKTWAFEVWEQLGFRAPDTVVLPAGNGTLLIGSYRGFSELRKAGCIDTVPKHVAVQTAACAPLAARFNSAKSGEEDYAGSKAGSSAPPAARSSADQPQKHSRTVAEGIAIAEPPLMEEMLKAVTTTRGTVLTVGEGEIRRALCDAVRSGLYIEPTAAAALAGLRQYAQFSPAEETTVGVVTGHGLKAAEKVAALTEKEES